MAFSLNFILLVLIFFPFTSASTSPTRGCLEDQAINEFIETKIGKKCLDFTEQDLSSISAIKLSNQKIVNISFNDISRLGKKLSIEITNSSKVVLKKDPFRELTYLDLNILADLELEGEKLSIPTTGKSLSLRIKSEILPKIIWTGGDNEFREKLKLWIDNKQARIDLSKLRVSDLHLFFSEKNNESGQYDITVPYTKRLSFETGKVRLDKIIIRKLMTSELNISSVDVSQLTISGESRDVRILESKIHDVFSMNLLKQTGNITILNSEIFGKKTFELKVEDLTQLSYDARTFSIDQNLRFQSFPNVKFVEFRSLNTFSYLEILPIFLKKSQSIQVNFSNLDDISFYDIEPWKNITEQIVYKNSSIKNVNFNFCRHVPRLKELVFNIVTGLDDSNSSLDISDCLGDFSLKRDNSRGSQKLNVKNRDNQKINSDMMVNISFNKKITIEGADNIQLRDVECFQCVLVFENIKLKNLSLQSLQGEWSFKSSKGCSFESIKVESPLDDSQIKEILTCVDDQTSELSLTGLKATSIDLLWPNSLRVINLRENSLLQNVSILLSNQIKILDINNSPNLREIKFLDSFRLNNLDILSIQNVPLKDISFLTDLDFPNLKFLNLSGSVTDLRALSEYLRKSELKETLVYVTPSKRIMDLRSRFPLAVIIAY